MQIEFTQRGFGRGEFTDTYGQACSIQASSSAEEDRIWLGAHDKGPHLSELGRMHLNRPQVAALIPYLQAFVDTGSFANPDKAALEAAHARAGRQALADALQQAATELEEDGFKELGNALRWLADPTPDDAVSDDPAAEEG